MKSCFRGWIIVLALGLTGLLPARGQSVRELDSLTALLQQARTDTTRLRLLLQLSAQARSIDQNRALHYAHEALRLSRHQADSAAWQAQALLMLGRAQRELGRQEEALRTLGQAQRLSQRHNLTVWLAASYIAQGHSYYMLGRTNETRTAFQMGLAEYKRLGDTNGVLKAYSNLGVIHQEQGQVKEALATDLLALGIAEQHPAQEFLEMHYTLLTNLAVLYNAQGEYQTAVAYSEKALRLLDNRPNPSLELDAVANLVKYLTNLEQYSAAQHYLTRGLALLRQQGEKNDPLHASSLYSGQAHIDNARANYPAAVEHIRMAIFYAKAIGHNTHVIMGLEKLADYERSLGHYARSLEAAKQCIVLSRQAQNAPVLVDGYQQLAATYAAMGQYQLAFTTQKRVQDGRDSLFSADKAKQLAEQATRFETEKKQAQIQLLERNAALQQRLRNLLGAGLFAVVLLGGSTYHRFRRERRAHHQLQLKDEELARRHDELERTQARLYRTLEDKEVLLKEVHHRVKNNLQVIASRLALQAGNKQLDPPALAILRDSQNWVRSVALIHEMLYRSEDLASVAFQPFLEQLAEQVHRTFAGSSLITWQVEASGICLSTNAAVPLGLVANELLSNAYKYAFAGGQAGHIGIELTRVPDGGHCLRVHDNGAGLPADFRLGTGSSLGLRLVQSLARRLEGRLEGRRLAPGAEFLLFFREGAPQASL